MRDVLLFNNTFRVQIGMKNWAENWTSRFIFNPYLSLYSNAYIGRAKEPFRVEKYPLPMCLLLGRSLFFSFLILAGSSLIKYCQMHQHLSSAVFSFGSAIFIHFNMSSEFVSLSFLALSSLSFPMQSSVFLEGRKSLSTFFSPPLPSNLLQIFFYSLLLLRPSLTVLLLRWGLKYEL